MSDYYVYDGSLYPSNELQHHGIKGMHWGIRRYQNPDGTLTAEGQKRYNTMKRDSQLYGNGIAKMERLNRSIGLEKNQKLEKETLVSSDFKKQYRSGIEYLQKINKELDTRKYDDIKSEIKLMDDGHEYVVTYLTDRNIGTLEYYTLIGKKNNVAKSNSTMKANTRSTANTEIDKLMSKSKALKSDFGGSSSMIDDPEYFEYVARTEYGLDTSELRKHLQKPLN